MNEVFPLVLLVIGAFVLVVALFSGLINSYLFVRSPLIAVLAGVLLGPRALGWFDPTGWGDP